MRSTDAGRRSRRHVLRSITAGAGVLAGASTFAAATEDGGDEPDPEDGWAWSGEDDLDPEDGWAWSGEDEPDPEDGWAW